MDARLTKDLIRRLDRLERQSVRFRLGEVTATAPLAVELGGSGVSSTDVRRLVSYTPTVGDRVAVLVWSNDQLVLGQIA